MSVFGDLRKTISYAGRNGITDTFYAARERLAEKARPQYQYVPPAGEVLASQRALFGLLEGGAAPEEVFGPELHGRSMPLLSVLVPAFNTKTSYLTALIESVLAQTYGAWELILADAGTSPSVREVAEAYAAADPRIHYHALPGNHGISGNTNAAAVYAAGDYVVFLDHDDLLAPDALFEAALGILKTDCEILYTDEDKTDETGTKFFEVNRKPDFNLDYFLANNYICHMLVMKRGLFLALKLRAEYDGAQDYDLLLRAPKSSVCHVAKVLYHWRVHRGSTAGAPGEKDYAADAGKRALEDHLRRTGISAKVTHSRHRGFYKITYEPDIFTARPDVGVVGGKVTDRHRRIIGGMMDADGTVYFKGYHVRESGPMHRADTMQDAEAVDVRSMEIRPELGALYEEVFGSPYASQVMLQDADFTAQSLLFCKRVKELGYRILFDPDLVRTF